MNEPSAPAPLGGQTRRSRKRILLELFIVTAGVLIALLIDSLVEWNRYRVLVNEARATLAREMADNGREVEQVLATMADRDKRIETALRFANEMLAEKKTAVNELQLGFDFTCPLHVRPTAFGDVFLAVDRPHMRRVSIAIRAPDPKLPFVRIDPVPQLFV